MWSFGEMYDEALDLDLGTPAAELKVDGPVRNSRLHIILRILPQLSPDARSCGH